MNKILVINGPNLNLLGTREPEIYGDQNLSQIETYTKSLLPNTLQLDWFQSNHEGEIIDKIQALRGSEYIGLIINPGGYSHSSVAIHDALKTVEIYKIEVHLSNTCSREDFRSKKITGRASNAVIEGLGKNVYIVAAQAILINEGKNDSNN